MRHLLCCLFSSYFILTKNKVHKGVATNSGEVYQIETDGGNSDHSKERIRSQTDEYGTNYKDNVSLVNFDKVNASYHCRLNLSIFTSI